MKINFYIKIIFIHWRYKVIIWHLQKKNKFKVVFFISHESVWKYEGIYRLMEKDQRFNPVVVVIPYIAFDEENMFQGMDQVYKIYSEKGYNVIHTFNKHNQKWLDLKKEINPDIVFFHAPYNFFTKEQYLISNFLDRLNCYVPYTFQTTNQYDGQYNQYLHNVVWKAFYQTIIHQNIALKYSTNKGRNVVVTGYPGIDGFLKNNRTNQDKKNQKAVRKIIWAPHHTIDGDGDDLNFSNFIRYNSFMIDLSKEFKNELFITFKPHPILKPKLYKHKDWGIEKTNAYFDFWEYNSFCAVNTGNYQQLFEDSDAMIHDCDSFMGEYLSLNKPVLYTMKDDQIKKRMNEFGQMAYDMHYHAQNEEDIIDFVKNIILGNKDIMVESRTDFINNFLVPPNSRTASMNIFMEISKLLNIDNHSMS